MHHIPLARPNINSEDLENLKTVINSGMLVQGKEVARFESRIADYVGTKHAIAVSNGTASLHLSLLALGIGPGDEVIIPAFSFVATANVVEIVGATPVFIDITDDNNIDISKIESAITTRTKAIMPVHEFGLAADMDKIQVLAKSNNLFIIEDAACALGATYNGQKVGSFGEAGSFSFHPRKAITSGEGGIITTNDDEIAKQLRILRNHGMGETETGIDFVHFGYNYRLTDMQASLLNSQFDRFEETIARKRMIGKRFLEEISHPSISLPTIPDHKEPAWQSFHVIVDDRPSTKEKLAASGIFANLGAQCIPEVPYYQTKYNEDIKDRYAVSHRHYHNGLVIPLYELLTDEEVDYIISTINAL